MVGSIVFYGAVVVVVGGWRRCVNIGNDATARLNPTREKEMEKKKKPLCRKTTSTPTSLSHSSPLSL